MAPTTTMPRNLRVLLGGKARRGLTLRSAERPRGTWDTTHITRDRPRKENSIRGETAQALRVVNARKLASKTRALMYEIEAVLDLDASKLRSYALHLENIAERWTTQAQG